MAFPEAAALLWRAAALVKHERGEREPVFVKDAVRARSIVQPTAQHIKLYLKPGDQMEIAFEGLMSLRTRITGPDGS